MILIYDIMYDDIKMIWYNFGMKIMNIINNL